VIVNIAIQGRPEEMVKVAISSGMWRRARMPASGEGRGMMKEFLKKLGLYRLGKDPVCLQESKGS